MPTSGDGFLFIGTVAPSSNPTGDQPRDVSLRVGSLWADTDAGALKRCTSLSPVTFVSTESGGSNHAILSATHTDSLAGTVVRGDLIMGNSTPAWARLAVGTKGRVAQSDGTDVTYQRPQLHVFTPQSNQPPAASFATLDLRNSVPLLDFDAAIDESAVFGSVLNRLYRGNGLTVGVYWAATTATSGDCVWDAQFERHQASTDDLDADGFAAVQSVTATAPATSGTVLYSVITFTNGAQMDSLAVGESFRLKITRDANNVADTMAGDAELLRVEVYET